MLDNAFRVAVVELLQKILEQLIEINATLKKRK